VAGKGSGRRCASARAAVSGSAAHFFDSLVTAGSRSVTAQAQARDASARIDAAAARTDTGGLPVASARRGQLLLTLDPTLWETWTREGESFEIVGQGFVRRVRRPDKTTRVPDMAR